MNSQDLRNLQEAYLDVVENQQLYEDYIAWDFGPKQKAKAKYDKLVRQKEAGGAPKGTATRANTIKNVAQEMRFTLDKDSLLTGINPRKQGLQPSTPRHTAAALRGAGGGTTARTQFNVEPLNPTRGSMGGGSSAQGLGSAGSPTGRYQVGGGRGYGLSGIRLADSYEYDVYDIVLSHLLDEGYAETPEAAEALMVNMSEEWLQSIMEVTGGSIRSDVPQPGRTNVIRADVPQPGRTGVSITANGQQPPGEILAKKAGEAIQNILGARKPLISTPAPEPRKPLISTRAPEPRKPLISTTKPGPQNNYGRGF